MRVGIYISLKPEIPDNSGLGILESLRGLGFNQVNQVRHGKYIELECATGTTRQQLEAMCQRLLTNPVIETYRIERLSRQTIKPRSKAKA